MRLNQDDLGPLEVASGWVLGAADTSAQLTASPADALAAFRSAIRPALERPPCVVAFSGGRDSSAVLAVAVEVARREGLPLPIPVTRRFPDHPAAEEASHQEEVVRHLGLTDWEIVEISEGDLDVIGPVARRFHDRYGLGWSPAAHTRRPMFERASSGALLTGYDGDAVLGGWRWQRLWHVLREPGCCARPRDLAWLGLAALPRWALEVEHRLRTEDPAPWLTDDGREELVRARATDIASEPKTWPARLEWLVSRRYHHRYLEGHLTVAADHEVLIAHPFMDAGFLAALKQEGGRTGPGTRTQAMRRLFGDLLPDAIVERRTKARFDTAYVTGTARAAMASWDAEGIDNPYVDHDALRRHWRSDSPHPRSAWLLKEAWFSTGGWPVEEPWPSPDPAGS